ncbi:hypothetical protein [Aestuariivirga sp.]|uniref:hypothetical protein n=1 Tax=Aestuariivirga sp. TaxID=2650926 RepID=UPI0039E2CB62
MSTDDIDDEHISGPSPGEDFDLEKMKELMKQFSQLSEKQRMELLFQAATDDLYRKIIMGQASHQDISNALKAVKDSQQIIAPPPTDPQDRERQAQLERQAPEILPPIIEDYHEDEEETGEPS